ncbi:MAG: hypothetical protein LBJ47_05715 [Tannerella sp.]|jgi:hypothetical protein|nr:hypothetical protein [Tannerella sp.]
MTVFSPAMPGWGFAMTKQTPSFRLVPSPAKNEAIQAQETTRIASFVAGDGRNTMHKNIPREV